MEHFRINAFKLALTAGIYCALVFSVATLLALLKIGGYVEFAQTLERYYGSWGYSVTPKGLFVGLFWGFSEGFVHFGLFALLYNRLLGCKGKSQ